MNISILNRSFYLYAGLFFLGIHRYTDSVTAAPYRPQKIAIIGSSTAVGTGATDYAHAWAGLYTTYLHTLNSTNLVVNLAVGGYTTYHELPTGTTNPVNRPAVDRAHNITAALALHPDLVIVNLPSNDAANSYAAWETETNFLQITAACLASNVPVWIATPQPRNLTTTLTTNLMIVKDWIIGTFPAHYLDFWTTVANSDGSINSAYSYGDGIHLNNAGHQVLYNRVVASRLYELVSGPRTLNMQPDNDITSVGFDTLPGINYILESTPDLTGWQDTTNILGSGLPVSLDVPATDSSSFFRLRLEAAP